MQIRHDDHFNREMGCTEADWLRWLPAAVGDHVLSCDRDRRQASIAIGAGRCKLNWAPLSDRQIALMCIPRLAVSFDFEGVCEVDREAFLHHFDLHMQRGGG